MRPQAEFEIVRRFQAQAGRTGHAMPKEREHKVVDVERWIRRFPIERYEERTGNSPSDLRAGPGP
jgi:hypothetical protein